MSCGERVRVWKIEETMRFGVEGLMRRDLMEDSVWRVRGCSV